MVVRETAHYTLYGCKATKLVCSRPSNRRIPNRSEEYQHARTLHPYPAVVDSNKCSYEPAYRETSVEVPPMSNPITPRPSSAEYAVLAYPTTPPAGPERMARHPLNCATGVRPPSDCMNSTFVYIVGNGKQKTKKKKSKNKDKTSSIILRH